MVAVCHPHATVAAWDPFQTISRVDRGVGDDGGMPTSWSLVLVKGQPRPDRPAAIGLAESQAISIGRESGECDVMLDSAAFPRLISRLHCRLAAKENEVVLQDCSVNGCSVDGALIARRAVLSEGSTIVFGPRGSLTEFTYRLQRTSSPTDEGTTAAGGDEGARKRARAKEPAPLSEEPAPPAEPHQLAEPAQPAQPAQPSQEPRPDGSQGAGSSQPLGLGPDELNGVMLEELQCRAVWTCMLAQSAAAAPYGT